MKRYWKRTWPCYLILFLLFFVSPLVLPVIRSLLSESTRLALIPYETSILYAVIGVSAVVVSFYAVWLGGNGNYDFLPVAATYVFLCVGLFVSIALGQSALGLDAPAYVPFVLYALPLLPQLIGIAIAKAIVLCLPRKGSES